MFRWWGRWQDRIIFWLGLWLFISPWVLAFAYNSYYRLDGQTPRANPWNDWAAGVLIFGAAAWALAITWGYWIEWFVMALGLWIFISPWVLGFANESRVAWDNWITGALVFLLALWSWWTVARPGQPPRATRRRPQQPDQTPASDAGG